MIFDIFTISFALFIPHNVYSYFFNLFLSENQGSLTRLENTEVKDLDSESENFKNIVLYIVKMIL